MRRIKALVKRTGELMPEAKLPRIERRFPRVTCEEGSRILGKAEIGDFSSEEEKKLGAIMAEKGHDFFFITKYPSEAKPFYIMVEEDRPEISRGFDLEFDGMEVTSGGQRETSSRRASGGSGLTRSISRHISTRSGTACRLTAVSASASRASSR
jgi:aspartyl/asparaginyl-tRNA synthetase